MNGQLLGQKFIVPDVASENPMLVVDAHENKVIKRLHLFKIFISHLKYHHNHDIY
ncbi:MAG: hypothetical protein PHQ17_01400 [Methanobacterium sp.]|nr:hypothetical protein [Methanobacterium sp.]